MSLYDPVTNMLFFAGTADVKLVKYEGFVRI